MRRMFRALAAILAFICFDAGSVVLTILLLCVGWNRPLSLSLIRWFWIRFVWLCRALRLLTVDTTMLDVSLRGHLLVANHPSLIDVVLLVSEIPKTLAVARHSLRKNPFFGFIVAKLLLPDDPSLLTLAPDLLKKGYNILIFPEGTRSPLTAPLHTFHRGAAQLALRTGAPICPIRIHFSRRILGKEQSPLDMGAECVVCTLETLPVIYPKTIESACFHQEAIQLTKILSEAFAMNETTTPV